MYYQCSFINCANKKRKKSDKRYRFYTFPIKDPKRCRQWIENCGDSSLKELNSSQLRNKLVCHTHFLDTCFRDLNATRILLNWNAIPTPHDKNSYEENDPLADITIKTEYIDPTEPEQIWIPLRTYS